MSLEEGGADSDIVNIMIRFGDVRRGKMRYFRDLSLLGLYCLVALFYGKSDIKMVVAVLCAVIMVCGCYSCTQKYRQAGILLAYGLSGFWNQDFIWFYPAFIYCSMSCGKRILVTIAGVVFYSEKISAKILMSLLLGCIIAAFMEYNTRKYITLKEEFRRTKDDSEERNLLLAEKNKMILEKQDYEIETAILKERNRIAREIHDNVGHVLSRSILLVGVKYCFISIVKEALANVSRHSNATEVKITVREHPVLFQLSMEDNGKEIEYNKQDTEGIGLTNMQERVNGLKGNFRIAT